MKFLLIAAAVLAAVYLWAVAPRIGRRKPQMQELMRHRFAHRGLHGGGVPENSLTAFRLAAERGLGVELDVHLTRDKRLVVIHDSDLQRMCGVEGKVERLRWEELQELRLMGTEERIPLLEEVLPILCGRSPAIIEVKVADNNIKELCSRLCRQLEKYCGVFCLESFDPRVLKWLRKNEPFLVRGQLTENFVRRPGQVKLGLPLRLAMSVLAVNCLGRPDFIAFHHEDRRGNPGLWLCRKVFRAPEVSWTVTDPAEMEAREAEGCAVIFEGFVPETKEL